MRISLLSACSLGLAVTLLAGPATRADARSAAAFVKELRGAVVAISDGRSRGLRRGDPLYSGDRIQTRRRASVTLEFTDHSRFDLGERADMRIERYKLSPVGEQSSFTSRIFLGAFRFISGLIAKRQPRSMGVRLAVATIGIRGTHVVGEAKADSAKVILLKPEGSDRKTAIEVSNQYGSVVIDKPGYGTEVPDAHSPPSPPRRMKLRVIRNLMRSMQTVGRISLPRPRLP